MKSDQRFYTGQKSLPPLTTPECSSNETFERTPVTIHVTNKQDLSPRSDDTNDQDLQYKTVWQRPRCAVENSQYKTVCFVLHS